ncbi:MAG: UbiA family prenyltransferase [Terriglobales bacterium]|jgi:4-hydroxybenzoate polyprenyltransferase/phosphoserine phosphatase
MGSVTGVGTVKALRPVLCVDLDGTLIRGDVLWECVLVLLKTRPLTLLLLPFWLLSGRAALKRQLAAKVQIDPARLPYRHQVLDLLRQEKAAGSRIALVTAADRELAESIARYVGLFDEVHASDGQVNLKGAHKAEFLSQHFAETGFEYMGDSAADVEVWRNARAAYVVGTEARAGQAAAVTALKGAILEPRLFRTSFRTSFHSWISALRGHHWAKNLLLFLPLALSHNRALEPLIRTSIGFALYGFCASGLYILNDLLDLHSDREHPWKKERPFAAGDISIPEGLFASFVLLSAALGMGFLLDVQFGLVLLAYAALTMLYSLYLKKIALLDVFVLSSFYSFRILAGALISATPLSQWFLAFSMFFFLSLAMAKRYSELLHASDLVRTGNSGRGYRTGDRELLLSLGVGSSFSAVVIFSLYVHSQDVRLLYSSPEFLFLLCPIVLYWLSRTWLMAHRGELKEDPVTLAIRDPVSYGVALASLAVIAASMTNINW